MAAVAGPAIDRACPADARRRRPREIAPGPRARPRGGATSSHDSVLDDDGAAKKSYVVANPALHLATAAAFSRRGLRSAATVGHVPALEADPMSACPRVAY